MNSASCCPNSIQTTSDREAVRTMAPRSQQTPKTQRRFGTPWGELSYVCRRIHHCLYVKKSPSSARRYLSRLEGLLDNLPENEMAILREEGLALLHELKGQKHQAIEHRKREIELTKRLQRSVRKSVQSGNYDERMAASILSDRDHAALEERRAILRSLEEHDRPGPQNGLRPRGQSDGASKNCNHVI